MLHSLFNNPPLFPHLDLIGCEMHQPAGTQCFGAHQHFLVVN